MKRTVLVAAVFAAVAVVGVASADSVTTFVRRAGDTMNGPLKFFTSRAGNPVPLRLLDQQQMCWYPSASSAQANATCLEMNAGVLTYGDGGTTFVRKTTDTMSGQLTAITLQADGGVFDTINVRTENAANISVTASYQQRAANTSWQLGSVGTQNVVYTDNQNGQRMLFSFGGIELGSSSTAKFGSGTSITGSGGAVLYVSTAPTISSGFGTSPSIVASNGSMAFEVNVGTGGTASSGVIGLPTATNGWNCNCQDITAPATGITRQTASSTTSCTLTNVNMSTGSAQGWAASDKLRCIAVAY